MAPTAVSLFSRFKLGPISDGFSRNFDEALEIMRGYGFTWVEIRNVFGVYNTETSPAQVQHLKESLDKYGFRVSVIDSALSKCALPATDPVKGARDTFGYAQQADLLKRACDRAHALGADKIRGFTFWRVAEPGKLSERIAEELGKAAGIANHAGMRLVIENEESCNAATAYERRLKTQQVVRVPGSSSAALTDSFTSSNLLFGLSIIGEVPAKAWRARNSRAKSPRV
jgi:sugar phosphate isomerase/epimerase